GVRGDPGAAGADRHVDAPRVARVDLDGVETGVTATRATPVLPPLIAVDSVDRCPGLTPVLAAEEPGWLCAGVDHPRLARIARADVPHGAHGDAHVLREAQALVALVPRLAAVRAAGHRGAPRPVAGGGVEPGLVTSRVRRHVGDGPAGHD